ncbi:MAG: sugar phosphate nucleotidyltransferase, partial [Candidatus Wallbacteria bacterium]|nr:sugar phosphate nucleotidyltransferase [Candidatus Wallbacteria bacterium]
MKVLIPVAGSGTRLQPLTHTLPKVLLPVAGSPMLAHILNPVSRIRKLSRVIFIIGHFGADIRRWVTDNYQFDSFFVEQNERRGLGHAVYLAKDIVMDGVREPLLIILGDTLCVLDSEKPMPLFHDAAIAVKTVQDPSRFGVAVIGPDGIVNRLVEKPREPVSDLALIGVYHFRNTELLFQCLEEIMERDIRTSGEFQLTDAMALMIKKGARIAAVPTKHWFDCGKVETLLQTNADLLREGGGHCRGRIIDSHIISPVAIDENSVVERSIVGPNV